MVYPIPWYSFLIVCGAALAIWLAAREEKRVGLPKDTIVDLALWVLPLGILGARLYYVIFSWSEYRDHPLSALYIWEGGLAIYGGLLAGLLAIALFCRRKRVSMLQICDILAPGVVLAQAMGRWGNYFNMEAYGVPLRDPALCFFPLAVQIPAEGEAVWHLATFFLESAWDFAVFLCLMLCRRRLFRRRGDVFRFYVLLYAAGRLVIEEFRMDSLYSSGVRVSQLLSLLAAVFVLVYFMHREYARPHPSRALGLLLAGVALLLAVPVLLHTLHVPFMESSLPALSARALLLAGFSWTSVCSLFLLYGGTAPSEVLYAHH